MSKYRLVRVSAPQLTGKLLPALKTVTDSESKFDLCLCYLHVWNTFSLATSCVSRLDKALSTACGRGCVFSCLCVCLLLLTLCSLMLLSDVDPCVTLVTSTWAWMKNKTKCPSTQGPVGVCVCVERVLGWDVPPCHGQQIAIWGGSPGHVCWRLS